MSRDNELKENEKGLAPTNLFSHFKGNNELKGVKNYFLSEESSFLMIIMSNVNITTRITRYSTLATSLHVHCLL